MPSPTFLLGEEAPRLTFISILIKYADSTFGRSWMLEVLVPHHGNEVRTGAVHDGQVGYAEIAIVSLERVHEEGHIGMVAHGAHYVVG